MTFLYKYTEAIISKLSHDKDKFCSKFLYFFISCIRHFISINIKTPFALYSIAVKIFALCNYVINVYFRGMILLHK